MTQAERNLLYAIRNYARFRKQLYVAVASNNGGSINGSSYQPVGVLSNNSVGGGGIGGSGLQPGIIPTAQTTLTSPQVTPGSSGSIALPGAITPAPSGYLNTMLQNIQVYIDKENIDVLSTILKRYRGLLDGDVVTPLQVQNVEQQLLAGRSTLLLDQEQYLDALDAFKLIIGVPADLSIEMDDSVLRPLMKQFRDSRAIIEDEQAAVAEASALIPLAKAPRLRAELLRMFQESTLVRRTPFARTIRERWAAWEKLSDKELTARLEDLRKEVQKLLDLEADRQKKEQVTSPEEQARLRKANSERDLGNFKRALRRYETAYTDKGQPKKISAAADRQRIRLFQDVVSFWQKTLVEAREDRWAAVRTRWPELPRCCVSGVDLVKDDLDRAETAAGQYALINRLDLMNVRGQVVDSCARWRYSPMPSWASSTLATISTVIRPLQGLNR